MMTLELDDDADQLLAELMEREHTDAAQAVKKALSGYLDALKTRNETHAKLTDFTGLLAGSSEAYRKRNASGAEYDDPA